MVSWESCNFPRSTASAPLPLYCFSDHGYLGEQDPKLALGKRYSTNASESGDDNSSQGLQAKLRKVWNVDQECNNENNHVVIPSRASIALANIHIDRVRSTAMLAR